jgi:hypothetical protein
MVPAPGRTSLRAPAPGAVARRAPGPLASHRSGACEIHEGAGAGQRERPRTTESPGTIGGSPSASPRLLQPTTHPPALEARMQCQWIPWPGGLVCVPRCRFGSPRVATNERAGGKALDRNRGRRGPRPRCSTFRGCRSIGIRAPRGTLGGHRDRDAAGFPVLASRTHTGRGAPRRRAPDPPCARIAACRDECFLVVPCRRDGRAGPSGVTLKCR